MITSVKISLLIVFLHLSFISLAQVTPQAPAADTVREFEILRGPSMRSIHIDSITTLQTIAGGAIVKQGTTIFNADSMVVNPVTHIAEAFGNVHINQADSVQTYAQYLKYIGTEKMAYLKKDIRLNDKKSTLYTQELDYNLGTGIGNYYNGGKVVTGKTTITSKEGTYYSDTKDVYFKNSVEVTEPKNHILTDSLLYNMQSQKSSYTGNTNIKNKEVDIYTTQGTYDSNTGNAFFTSRTTVRDSSGRVYIANSMALDDKSGNAQLEGNAIVKDSANGFIVFGNQVFLNKKNNSFLATRKPVLIIIQKNDSTYIAADTIFSGYTTVIKNEDRILRRDSIISTDSINVQLKTDSTNIADSLKHEVPFKGNKKNDSAIVVSPAADSLRNNLHVDENMQSDSAKIVSHIIDSVKMRKNEIQKEQIQKMNLDTVRDSVPINKLIPDSVAIDSSNIKPPPKLIDSADSINNFQKDTVNKSDSAVRYFLAFHHVRIFNDSLQSVCDSLFLSAKDSIFRLYYDPVVWSGHSQIAGDTIFLYTKNKKAERLYVFERGMIVNKTTQGFYNQMAGKTINGYFKNGVIDYMRVKGSQSESIYYAQDEDSAYLGMNRASGDVIDLYFKNDDLIKVLFVNDIKGKFYPMKQIPEDQRFLKNFIWLDDKRPKNKLELFE
jgi:lipopolysaccharide export system protein LptA